MQNRIQGKMLLVALQLFASFDDVVTANADAFGEDDTTRSSFDAVSGKLKELGYDVLINHREKAEFVPTSRLNDVVAQRETFKQQAEQAIVELNKLKSSQGMTPEAQAQINGLIEQNEKLIDQLKETNIQVEIMSSASDAINSKDVLPFIDMTKIKLDKDGNIVSGVKEELDRLRTEKPYLFGKQADVKSSKGGFDNSGSNSGAPGSSKPDMNAAIRRAAFGNSRSF